MSLNAETENEIDPIYLVGLEEELLIVFEDYNLMNKK